MLLTILDVLASDPLPVGAASRIRAASLSDAPAMLRRCSIAEIRLFKCPFKFRFEQENEKFNSKTLRLAARRTLAMHSTVYGPQFTRYVVFLVFSDDLSARQLNCRWLSCGWLSCSRLQDSNLELLSFARSWKA